MNLFWYRFWFNDKISQQNIQQDDAFSKLIYYYLLYGTCFPQNLFLNKFWYANYYAITNKKQFIFNEKYFRYVEMINKVINERGIQKFRNKIKHIFDSKIWILKYQKWLIINFYNFQPINNKKNLLKKKKELNFFITKFSTNKQNIKRIKLFLFSIHFYLKHKNNLIYKF